MSGVSVFSACYLPHRLPTIATQAVQQGVRHDTRRRGPGPSGQERLVPKEAARLHLLDNVAGTLAWESELDAPP